MIKRELATGIIHYSFPPRRETSSFGDVIIAVIHESEAVLIDAGYQDEMQRVIDDLAADGITINKVIISHFHGDHLLGMNLLPDTPIYGAACYAETLAFEGHPESDLELFKPSVAVSSPTILTHGIHEIEIIPWPGHSVCTVLTKINGSFLHVADEMMFTVDGKQMLPYLCDGMNDISRQLESFARLKGYSALTIIPAHGLPFDGKNLQNYLKNLENYLKAIQNSDGEISYKDAVKDCDTDFAYYKWHKNNCKK